MPQRIFYEEMSHATTASELFYAKNLGLLTHHSRTLSLRSIQEMELSGMQLGTGCFLLGLMHITDTQERGSSAYLGQLSTAAQGLMQEVFCQHFLCHMGPVAGDIVMLFCFPHVSQLDSPEISEAKAVVRNFTVMFREQFPEGRFQVLLSNEFRGYSAISAHFENLRERLQYQLFMGQYPAFSAGGPPAPKENANPQYEDNDAMVLLAGRMVTAISRRQHRELQALTEETLSALFSGGAESLSPVHFKLYVYLCALLKNLETRSIVDHRFTLREDLFSGLTSAQSYHEFCRRFHDMIQTILRHYDAAQGKEPTSGAARLQQIREYCDGHFASPTLTVSALAELFGISQPQLSASFKRQFGISLLSYLNQQRINKAKELLTTTKKPQAEIAVLCGFSNVTTMQRQFQKVELCTPGQYRL